MKSLTTRQAVFLMVLAQVSTKIQRMPAILSQNFGRNGWLFLLLSLIPDALTLLVVLRISVLTKGKTISQALSSRCGKPVAKIYLIIIALFFLFKVTTPFKGTHEFFVSTIFDFLEWKWFSIIFLVLIAYMAASGLNRLGRTAEILWFFILLGYVGVMVLSVPTARFYRILPIELFSAKEFFAGAKHLTAWLGDFVLVLFFVGRVKENKFKTAIFSSFVITSIFVAFFCLTFYAVFDNLSTLPNVAISSITEFSLLSINLGRIDWILVLFAMSTSVISCGLFALVSCESFSEATSLPKKAISIVIASTIYILDIYILHNAETFLNFAYNIASWFVLFVNFVLPIFVWIALVATKNKKSKYDFYPFLIRPKSMQELKIKQWNKLKSKNKLINQEKIEIPSTKEENS